MALIDKLNAIGDAIRENTGKTDKLTLDEMPNEIASIFESGQKSEYDRFWDAYQNNGNICIGLSMFSGYNWNDEIYNPKYTIKVRNFSSMYQVTTLSSTKVPIDVTQGTGTNVFFNAINMKNIVKLIVTDTNTYNSWFYACTALEEIGFEGTIGKSLDIHWSTKLSFESLVSIVGALSKTVSGQTLTLPTTARQTYDNATISGAWDNLVSQYTNWTFAYA